MHLRVSLYNNDVYIISFTAFTALFLTKNSLNLLHNNITVTVITVCYEDFRCGIIKIVIINPHIHIHVTPKF